MDYNTQENYDYFLNKIINLEIENKELITKNKELKNIFEGAQEIIKNIKLENTNLRVDNKTLWDNLNKE